LKKQNLQKRIIHDTIVYHKLRITSMKRAIINFSEDFDYQDFKTYAEHKHISLSRAILELAKSALEDLEDKRLGQIALERLKSKSTKSLSSKDFWNKADEL
jgi:predicted DNA-binding protein